MSLWAEPRPPLVTAPEQSAATTLHAPGNTITEPAPQAWCIPLPDARERGKKSPVCALPDKLSGAHGLKKDGYEMRPSYRTIPRTKITDRESATQHHKHSTRRRAERQGRRNAPHTSSSQPGTVTLRLCGRPATLGTLAYHIREQDKLMRRHGLTLYQRSYVHANARADMYRACRTDADYQLYQDAWALVIEEGTVPLAEDVPHGADAEPGRCLSVGERLLLVAEASRVGRGEQDA
jgi:hypothetical protein